MGDRSGRLSRSVEDYLKVIYALTEQGTPASTNAIAAALEVRPASVTGMIKRLAEFGYLQHERYRGVRLTQVGSVEALRVIRRHRVLETYLVERLGYSWDDVHREAERLEHAASDQLVNRMAGALEHPLHDPHGSPIPTSSGEIEAVNYHAADECAPGSLWQIRAVRDDDPERLRDMELKGLFPGVQILIQRRSPQGGATVAVGGSGGPTHSLSPEVARRIFVSPARESKD